MGDLKKILVFATQHLQTGGIESHLQKFCEEMSASGVQIDLVILNSGMLPETERFFKEKCNRVYLGHHGRSYKRLWWLITTALKLRGTKYDALYTNGQGSSAGMFAKLVRYKNWVHHHHTAGDATDQSYWSQSYVDTMKKADHVIACAQRNAASMSAALHREIDVVSCFSRKVDVDANAISPDVKLKFGYFGRLIKEKGVDVICKLSEEPELKDVEFNLWGEGPVYPASYFEQYPNVKYNGTYTGLDGLSKAIGYLDAYLLLTTHGEGLPISLLEVMSAGLPWLSTDKGGITDIACDPLSTRVIAELSTYEEMKAAVVSLAEDIRAGKLSREKQIRLYNDMFSAPALVKKWTEILSAVEK